LPKPRRLDRNSLAMLCGEAVRQLWRSVAARWCRRRSCRDAARPRPLRLALVLVLVHTAAL